MKYISCLILTEQEAKDHVSDYENYCKSFRNDPRPQSWNNMTLQQKIRFMCDKTYWFQSTEENIDVVDVLRTVEVI